MFQRSSALVVVASVLLTACEAQLRGLGIGGESTRVRGGDAGEGRAG